MLRQTNLSLAEDAKNTFRTSETPGDDQKNASLTLQKDDPRASATAIISEKYKEWPKEKVMQYIADQYNLAKLRNASINEQTILYFDQVSPIEKMKFDSSTRRILQLGVSHGKYVGKLCSPTREVIGYDLSKEAIQESSKRGIIGRQINLNAIEVHNQNEVLSYDTQLSDDLLVPVDLLVIRVLEYLNPDAVALLLLRIIDLMKPGSRFFLDSESGSGIEMKNSKTGDVYIHNIEPGYIPSFFAPRTDINIDVHDLIVRDSDHCLIEHFIVTKR